LSHRHIAHVILTRSTRPSRNRLGWGRRCDWFAWPKHAPDPKVVRCLAVSGKTLHDWNEPDRAHRPSSSDGGAREGTIGIPQRKQL